MPQELSGAIHPDASLWGPIWQTAAFKSTVHQVIPETVYKLELRQAQGIGQSTLKSILQKEKKRKKKPKQKTKPSQIPGCK